MVLLWGCLWISREFGVLSLVSLTSWGVLRSRACWFSELFLFHLFGVAWLLWAFQMIVLGVSSVFCCAFGAHNFSSVSCLLRFLSASALGQVGAFCRTLCGFTLDLIPGIRALGVCDLHQYASDFPLFAVFSLAFCLAAGGHSVYCIAGFLGFYCALAPGIIFSVLSFEFPFYFLLWVRWGPLVVSFLVSLLP